MRNIIILSGLRKLGAIAFLAALPLLAGCSYLGGSSSSTSGPDNKLDVGKPDMSGKDIAVRVCAACHGKYGQAESPMFSHLAGQQKDYTIAQLFEFRNHSRSSKEAIVYMWGVTRTLTDQQIHELADYYSSQSPMRGKKSNSTLLVRGQKIFENGLPGIGVAQCNSCHGSDGGGMGSVPRIAGQHAEYILKQILAYQFPDDSELMEVGGKTWAPRIQALHRNLTGGGAVMTSVVKNLSPADAEAVAIYISSMNQ